MSESPVSFQPTGSVTSAVQTTATVVEQQKLARDTYRLRLQCPEIAERITPGQFFMLRAAETNDPLLARPFALYDVYQENGEPTGIDLGYLVIGKLTTLMTTWQTGERVEIWGPLGNGFPPPEAEHLALVGGGIGYTPFLAVGREALGLQRYGNPPRDFAKTSSRVTFCYGVRTAEYAADLSDFSFSGLDIRLATDDGSRGRHGFVTDLLTELIGGETPPATVFCCGPEPMMKKVAEICQARSLPCLLSLESPMACGFGACFSCVVPVRLDDGSWDYRRSCVEGPVFSAERLIL